MPSKPINNRRPDINPAFAPYKSGTDSATDSSTRCPPDFTNFLSRALARRAPSSRRTKVDKGRKRLSFASWSSSFLWSRRTFPPSCTSYGPWSSFSLQARSSSSSSRFHVRPRVRVGSGCTEAIYFWHPFLLRLVHPFIICICFCRPVPVGPVFVGPLGAHVSIFLVPATPPSPPSPNRRHHRRRDARFTDEIIP